MSIDERHELDPALIEVRRLSDRQTLGVAAAGQLSPYEIGSSLPFTRVQHWTIADVVWVPSHTPPRGEVLHSNVLFLTDADDYAFVSHDGSIETRCDTFSEALRLASDQLRQETARGVRTS